MFAPIRQALAEDGQIGGEHVVLDVATSPGEPALSLSVLVGPIGKIFAVDPVPGMVAGAWRAAERRGVKNVQFAVAFAEQLPFSDDAFHAVTGRIGIMLFPLPIGAIRELLRALKPGGKLALAVRHFAKRNLFHHLLARVIDRHVESPALAPDASDTFRFASPGKLLEILIEAGVIGAGKRLLRCTIKAQVLVEKFWALCLEMSERLWEKITTLSKDRVSEVNRQALEAPGEFSTKCGMSFLAEELIVTGAQDHST